MSGHSKWSQIKRQKGVADQKRGQVFTRLANTITIAVRQSGGLTDPSSNFKLRLAIEKARASNMPKENIERAIDRGSGKGQDIGLEEVVYEGFAQYGVAVMVECITDNKLRTQSQIKSFFEKNGGALAGAGAVSYLFSQSGQITLEKTGSLEEIFSIVALAGASDIEEASDAFDIYTNPQDLHKVKIILEQKGLKIVSAEIIMKPTTVVTITDKEKADKTISFLQNLEELDDVQKVYSNLDIVV